MGVIRTVNNRHFHQLKRLVIQFDTYCSTGCKYCFLASLKSNPIKYDIDRLDNFLEIYHPEAITLYGADTFINFELYEKLLNKIVKINSLKYLSNVTELIKLERDLDNIIKIYQVCKENNITYGLTFSMDLVGKKKIFDFSNLLNLSKTVLVNEFLLNIIVTKETIDEIYNNIETIVEEINNNYNLVKEQLTLKYKITINFEAVEDPIDNIEEKLKHIFYTLDKCEIKSIIKGDENFTTFGCEARDLNGIFLDLNGDITSCGKMLPSYEIKNKVSALDFKPENLISVKEDLEDFKTYNNDVIMKHCKDCKARFICSPCPKTIESLHKENFNKDVLKCQFYKTQFEVYEELNKKGI